MSLEPLTLYKFMTLYMLNKVNFPLTNNQISSFFLNKEYTTYFIFQQKQEYLLYREQRCLSAFRFQRQGHQKLRWVQRTES